MTDLLRKLNYKHQERIAVINAEAALMDSDFLKLEDVKIDTMIDPRYPYSFMILFVKKIREVDQLTPLALHNLTADGILWFCYPKKSSKTYKSELNRDHGWKALHDAGLRGVRSVSIDDNWSALRFRNVKYIKSVNRKI